MTEKLLDYTEIVDHFSEGTIHDRYRFLYDRMREYIQTRGLQDVLFVSEDLLHRVVMDYFSDVYRLKKFHKIDLINMEKITAYTVYWVMRRKPIQFMPRDPVKSAPVDQKVVFANEGFCTTLIADEMLSPEEMAPLPKDKEDEFLSLMENIHFTLKYRNIDRQSLESVIFAFKTGWQRLKKSNNSKDITE